MSGAVPFKTIDNDIIRAHSIYPRNFLELFGKQENPESKRICSLYDKKIKFKF